VYWIHLSECKIERTIIETAAVVDTIKIKKSVLGNREAAIVLSAVGLFMIISTIKN